MCTLHQYLYTHYTPIQNQVSSVVVVGIFLLE